MSVHRDIVAPVNDRHAAALFADLFETTSRAHTEVTVLRAVTETLVRHLALRWIEVGFGEGDAASTFLDSPGAPSPSRVERGARRSLVTSALEGGAQLFVIARLSAASSRSPEVTRARAAGAETLALLPLRDLATPADYAMLALGPSAHGAPSIALLDALARAIVAAIRQAQTLSRVAAVSRRAHADNKRIRVDLDRAVLPPTLVAASPAMRSIVLDVLPLVAQQETTVLLRGETGTGKEVLARRIHALSPRAHRPFVQINSGALPEGLIESALFGHERGAFTGATARHLGVFERADRGTLFLDEVGELPPSAQVKLLRVLQEGELERVGGGAPIRVDVRVIAATHRDLEAMLDAGTFRADLYYRLAVFPILVPPLRDRRDDIAPLAVAILHRLAARFGRPAPRLTEEALATLASLPFPGNVRELENVIERALVLTRGSTLSLATSLAVPRAPREAATIATITPYSEAMRRSIDAALTACAGKIYGADGAAARLGLRPTTLQSKMKKLGVSRLDPRRN
jgi:transcriptional regulator with GAF, ATPase, and Fis domain